MNIKDVLYKAPEMSEKKLLEIIEKYSSMLRIEASNRITELYRQRHGEISNLSNMILDEYDLIQDKKSLLTKSQRDQITGFIGLCMIKMAKGNEK